MKSIIFLIFVLSFLYSSCEPVNPPKTVIKGPLPITEIEGVKGIPSDFGKLEAVTTHARYRGWAQLWFVDEKNTIRMVDLQFEEGRLGDRVIVIPRY